MSRHKFQQGSNVVQSLNGCGARRSQAGNGSFHVTKPWLTTENVSLTAEAGFYYYLSPTEQEILFTRSADAVPAYTVHPDCMPTANETATSAVSNITQEQLPGYASLKREPSSPLIWESCLSHSLSLTRCTNLAWNTHLLPAAVSRSLCGRSSARPKHNKGRAVRAHGLFINSGSQQTGEHNFGSVG